MLRVLGPKWALPAYLHFNVEAKGDPRAIVYWPALLAVHYWPRAIGYWPRAY